MQAYTDVNGNGMPDDNEWINGMSVEVEVSTDTLSKRTENGVALFDMSVYRPGLNVTVNLEVTPPHILDSQKELLLLTDLGCILMESTYL